MGDRKRNRRGLGSVGVAQETLSEGRRLLKQAENALCPLRMEFAMRARGNALLSEKRFKTLKDSRSAEAAKHLAEAAASVAYDCLGRWNKKL